ncbi:hypothetical protein Fcan01_14114 [Folsomia candida]|uniref:EamA domain-containing protein n=1 Tax=Folsomia candida TaxID=158441 RepID=A0A226E206_FOLCA|nr:hypothetical protein Fcan01_14114 [Folsomia candida]
MVKPRFKTAALAIQANIKIRNRFANAVEDPNNPYSNHSETESSSEEEDEAPPEAGVEAGIVIVGPDGRSSIVHRQVSTKKKKKASPLRRYRGMLLALLSSLIFSLGALVAKKLHHFHPFSIAFWRFQGAFLPVLPIIMHKLSELQFPPPSLLLLEIHVTRGLIDHRVLNAHSRRSICEDLPRREMWRRDGVSRPPLLTGASSFDSDTLIGSGLALGCMILAAISYTVLRYIRKVHYSVTTLMFGVWGTFENLFLAILFSAMNVPNTLGEWGIVGSSIVVVAVLICGFRKWLRGLPVSHPTRARFRYLMM